MYKALVENSHGNKVKVIRNKNGKEYLKNNFEHISEECGIQMQHLVPYTPQQNGVAEHKNKSLKRWQPV